MVFAVQDLHIEFGPRVLFDSLSFVVEQGDRIAFAGQNGAGKSTLMKCIVGALEPDHGKVLLPKHTQVGYLPQDGIHISGAPLLDLIVLPLCNHPIYCVLCKMQDRVPLLL